MRDEITKSDKSFKSIMHEDGFYAATFLSRREVDCLYWAGKGMCTKQIARTLNLSPETVRSYKKTILLKSNSTTLIEAVVKSIRQVF